MLFAGERNAGDVGAADFGEIEAEPTPAAANVEYALVRFNHQLGGQVPFLRELGVVKRQIGFFEICAAVLPIGVQKERVKSSIEIVMMRDVAARPWTRIKLAQTAPQIAQQPLRSCPVRNLRLLAEGNSENVGDRTFFDHE